MQALSAGERSRGATAAAAGVIAAMRDATALCAENDQSGRRTTLIAVCVCYVDDSVPYWIQEADGRTRKTRLGVCCTEVREEKGSLRSMRDVAATTAEEAMRTVEGNGEWAARTAGGSGCAERRC